MIEFLKHFNNILENRWIQLSGVLAIFFGLFADAMSDSIFYWISFIILVILIIIAVVEEYRISQKMLDTIYIPLVIKIDDNTDTKYVFDSLIQKIERNYQIENYKENVLKYLKINLEDFIFEYNGDLFDFDKLLSFSRIISYNINKLEKNIKKEVVFHIAYYRRPAIAFMFGVIFRTKGVVVYQNNDGGQTFEKVVEVNDRKYKERVEEFEKYEIKEQVSNKKELLLVINSASHNVDINAPSLKKYKDRVILTLKPKIIDNKKISGTIPYNEDWSLYAREIYTIIHNYRLKYQKIIIAHSMPEALAFLVGMGIENYWNIEITQYHKNDYKFIYNMQNVIFYF